MDIISLLITIAGILIILGLYILGRLSRSKMPREKPVASVPKIIDDKGERFTSVLDDIPATDGSTPKPGPAVARVATTVNTNETADKQEDTEKTNQKPELQTKQQTKKAVAKKQHVLFISAKDAPGLDGNQIDKVLNRHGLHFGDMDIYHYYPEGDTNNSLFRVANGVKPWTLTQNDLKDKLIAGLSLLLVTPTSIDNQQAINTFVETAKLIANDLHGSLKNQSQQPFTEKDKKGFLQDI